MADRAGVASRKIGINRNVNANSASARSRLAEAKGAVAVRNVAAANKAAVSKAADDKSSWEEPRRLVIVSWINERREATPAAFLCAYHRRRSALSCMAVTITELARLWSS